MTSNHRKLAGGTGIGLAAVIVLLALSAAAPATVVVDLRFSDGSKTKVAQPGDFSIDVWAQVTGTDPALRDGLIWIYGSVQSTQINGGAVAGGAGTGITGNQAAPLFTITPFVGAPGDPQNVTADGIQDWGTPFGLGTASIKYNSALSDAEGVPGVIPVYSDAPGVIAHAIPNGTEYKVGTLTFHIDSFIQGEGVTQINWLRRIQSVPPPQMSFPDELNNTASAAYLDSTPGVNSVQFIASPEPVTAGLAGLALAGLGLAATRRRAR